MRSRKLSLLAVALLTGCIPVAPAPKAAPAKAVAKAPSAKQPTETPAKQSDPAPNESAAEAVAAVVPAPTPTSPSLDPVRKRVQAREWDAADEELVRFLRDVSQPDLRQPAEALAEQVRQGRALDAALQKASVDIGSEDRQVASAARALLWQNDALAARLLTEACKNHEPRVVAGALGLLADRRQVDPAATAALGVLGRPAQAAAWPAAIETLVRVNPPTAGERLLELALAAESPAQRTAALEALAQCSEPPARTLPALLPILAADGPALPAALWAAARAAQVHHQCDFATRRGLEALSPAEFDEIQQLKPRLRKLAPPESEPASPVACGAWLLATALGFEQPRPITGVRALAASGDRDPAGLVDGIWKTTDAKPTSQWVDPTTGPEAWVVLDLEQPQIVTGVRIWNYSLYGPLDRGWRKVEIEITDDLAAEPRNSTMGNLPRYVAGLKDADHSSLIEIPAIRGRYVKLFAREVWIEQADQKVSGLAEIEVQGVKAPPR